MQHPIFTIDSLDTLLTYLEVERSGERYIVALPIREREGVDTHVKEALETLPTTRAETLVILIESSVSGSGAQIKQEVLELYPQRGVSALFVEVRAIPADVAAFVQGLFSGEGQGSSSSV
jgi:hypothetical protein